jgi:methionine-gamma-lyase
MTRKLKPETRMMTHGYNPFLSEGAVKPPIFANSTYAFKNAEQGKRFFEVATGKSSPNPEDVDGLVYSRFNHPNMQIFEERLALWEEAEGCAAFGSGMSAIFTLLFTFMKQSDVILYSEPLYGCTDNLIKKILPERLGIVPIGFTHEDSEDYIVEKLDAEGGSHRLSAVFVETPSNPTNTLVDIPMCSRIAKLFSERRRKENRARLIVDNTFLGPVFQHPFEHGADLVVYSATKYLGGHSDLIAGACLGSNDDIQELKKMRGSSIGDMLDPFTSWMLLRSLETLKIRMDYQAKSAQKIAHFLDKHKKVENVHYLGLLKTKDPQYNIYKKQCTGPGAVISFDIKNGEKAAYRFLDSLKVIKLAVSLGSTESLAQHPATMTHAGVDDNTKTRLGITDSLIRLSVGIEDADDLIYLLDQALEAV